RGYRGVAAALGLVAVLTRETTVLFLVGGLLAAHRQNDKRWPWVAALGVCAVSFAINAHLAGPFLVSHGGTETPLLGTGRPPLSILRWMGYGLPAGVIVGPLLWAVSVLALVGRVRALPAQSLGVAPRPGFDDLMLPFLTLPLLGLLITRDYWG